MTLKELKKGDRFKLSLCEAHVWHDMKCTALGKCAFMVDGRNRELINNYPPDTEVIYAPPPRVVAYNDRSNAYVHGVSKAHILLRIYPTAHIDRRVFDDLLDRAKSDGWYFYKR